MTTTKFSMTVTTPNTNIRYELEMNEANQTTSLVAFMTAEKNGQTFARRADIFQLLGEKDARTMADGIRSQMADHQLGAVMLSLLAAEMGQKPETKTQGQSLGQAILVEVTPSEVN
jgi:hypothetical protein